MESVKFKPSEVYLAPFPFPLASTYGRMESEAAAAIVVRACAVLGDEWRAVSSTEVEEVLAREVEGDPLYACMRNPFWRPDAHELVANGFATWEGETEAPSVKLTAEGLARLEKWTALLHEARGR